MMLENTLLTAFFLFLLLVIHETGHVLTAKILQLNIRKVGFTLVPFPHVFVRVDWPRVKKERTFFLMSGFATILLLFALVLIAGISFKPLLIALCLQLIIETNPIYSDFVIIKIVDKVIAEVRKTRQPYPAVYKRIYKKYLFTSGWYVHFFVWTIIVVSVLNVIKNI